MGTRLRSFWEAGCDGISLLSWAGDAGEAVRAKGGQTVAAIGTVHQQPKLRITNPRQDWVRNEFEGLLAEWVAWAKEVDQIQDQPIPEGQDSDTFKDGKENILKHQMLQEKTRVFLDNNVEGHNFIHGFDGNHIDRRDLRLKNRVEHRLTELHTLTAALTYALVAEGFWEEKGKELVHRNSKLGVDAAAKLIASYLENPMKSD